jgi:hypothetical protein
MFNAPTWGFEMSNTSKPVYRIGAGAGFAGDRVDPAVALAASGQVDAVALECLAERTLVPAINARAANPEAGADPRLRRRLTPLLPAAASTGCKIISNLGAANPRAAGQSIASLAKDLGIKGLRVAAIEGDDVMHLHQHVAWVRPIEGRLIGAHAYLGCVPMALALEDGADVVVTGRVADSALFAAPVRQFLDGSDNALAGALTVGHLLECGGQLTGGNYETLGGPKPGNPLSAADFAALGYPLAHVYADGSADITVLDDAPALVDALTCTLQLLYEVHNPARYATPDLVLDFTGIRFEQSGPKLVHMSGARTSGPPPTLKVAGFLELPGFIADCEIGFAGTGALARAQRAADTLRLRLSDWPAQDIAIDLVGMNAVLRAGSLARGEPAELRVHVSARCQDLEMAQVIEDEVYALTLSGPAGGCSVRSERRNRIEVLDGFIDPSLIRTNILWSHS